MSRLLHLLLLAVLAAPSLVSAQEAPRGRFDAARFVPAPVLPALEVAPVMTGAEAGQSERSGAEAAVDERARRSFLSTVLHTLGGAVIGGWVGFVGSQVALSDWDKDTNSQFSTERKTWVAGGMVLGVLGSRLMGGSSSAPAIRPGVEVRRPRTSRNVLTREEIVASGANTVYELVTTQRKEWLVTRGTNSIRETARGVGAGRTLTVTPGQAAVVVYMDDIRIGEVERMREFLITDIMEVEFIEPNVAAYRYGSGHSHGVILLKTSVR